MANVKPKTIALAMMIAASSASPAPATGQPIVVKAAPLEQVVIHPETSAPATVVSLGDSRIGAEINAPIREIPVRVGDIVEPDGVLVRLDCGDYDLNVAELQARLAALEARIQFARQQRQRAQLLKRQNTISQELLEQRESELASLSAERDASRAGLDMAKRNLDKCTLRAPFKAVVLERLASVGEYATPGLALVRVLDIDHLEISAQVIAEEASALNDAGAIVFRYSARDYPLKLRVLTPVIDPQTRTREVRLLFQGEPALPGATGRLVWRMGSALPADLLVRRNQRLGVLLAENGKAHFYPLPGAREGRSVAVDLPKGAMIITEGRFALDDGDAIEIVN